jgi:hypothetical protein
VRSADASRHSVGTISGNNDAEYVGFPAWHFGEIAPPSLDFPPSGDARVG